MTAVVAIIPARGGSKGVPGKNLRLLGGKPLIVWSIEQARACHAIEKVVVSTDDEEIARVACQAGADVPALRPLELASDTAATELALVHMLTVLEAGSYRPDTIVLLQPTSPLRRAGTVDSAIAHFYATGADSLLGVVETHAFFWREVDSKVVADYDWTHRPRRQDIPSSEKKYRENGSIYITKSELLRKTGNRLGGHVALFKMADEEGWEIDTVTDFVVIEGLMKVFGAEI
ncbi:MAG: acylneuraminate cytidylyltransferase family protein [Pseudorhodoplanes sp.]|nr:acylneuraminate cytidylyltransferase family protein [Pseudorhodoplanes sp.]